MFIADFEQVNFGGWRHCLEMFSKMTKVQMFPCEFCKRSQNNFCMLEGRESRISIFYLQVLSHGKLDFIRVTFSYRYHIAVYYSNWTTAIQGDIYYRESRDFLEKSRATSLIRKHRNDLQFTPTYLWMITWDDVHEYYLNNKVSILRGNYLNLFM